MMADKPPSGAATHAGGEPTSSAQALVPVRAAPLATVRDARDVDDATIHVLIDEYARVSQYIGVFMLLGLAFHWALPMVFPSFGHLGALIYMGITLSGTFLVPRLVMRKVGVEFGLVDHVAGRTANAVANAVFRASLRWPKRLPGEARDAWRQRMGEERRATITTKVRAALSKE